MKAIFSLAAAALPFVIGAVQTDLPVVEPRYRHITAALSPQPVDCDHWAQSDVTYCERAILKCLSDCGIECTVNSNRMHKSGIPEETVVLAAFRTPEMLEQYDFPDQPLTRMHFGLYALRDKAEKLKNTNLKDWGTLSVAYAPIAMGRNDDRTRFFKDNSIQARFYEFPQSVDAVAAVIDGQVDALMLYSHHGSAPEGLVEVLPISERNVYFAVRKGNKALFDGMCAMHRRVLIHDMDFVDSLRREIFHVEKPEFRVMTAVYVRGGLHSISPIGEESGFIDEWLVEIKKRGGIAFEPVYGTFDECLKSVAAGELDLVCGLTYSKERIRKYGYTHSSVGELYTYLWTKEDSPFGQNDPSTWNDLRVGLLAGAKSSARLKLQLAGVNGKVTFADYPTSEDLYLALDRGEVDGICDIERTGTEGLKRLFSQRPQIMYFCTAKNKPLLLDALNDAIVSILEEDPHFIDGNMSRHFTLKRRDELPLTIDEIALLDKYRRTKQAVSVDISGNLYFARRLFGAVSLRTGLSFTIPDKFDYQESFVNFNRGETELWIPFPHEPKWSVNKPQAVFTANIQPGKYELYAGPNADRRLVTIIRRALEDIGDYKIDAMYQASLEAAERERHIFGLTQDEVMTYAGYAVIGFIGLIGVGGMIFALFLRRSNQRAAAANRKAESAAMAKNRFLATMSHELRTPLNAVLGFSEFLSDMKVADPKEREYIKGISTSGNALLSLINDILDLSKLESGKFDLRLGRCDVAALLRELPAIFGFKLHEQESRLRISIAEKLPPLRLSQQAIRQILLNLVGNSVKFTRRGEILVEADYVNGRFLLTVADTGSGISEAKQKKLFDAYVQDIGSRMATGGDNAAKGTGLGLPIVKKMVDSAGGIIVCTSRVGEGTKFNIVIPRVEIYQDTAVALKTKSDRSAAEKRAAASALVVDDMEFNRKIIGIHLKKAGLNDVTFAENGVEALAALKAYREKNGRNIDLVITDVWMPEMNGPDLAKAIRNDPLYKGVRVVACTADVAISENFDVSAFEQILTKPITGEKIKAALYIVSP